ncbi:MAG: hypothetical protein ABJF10_26450 [Chthoniobacter sp.]|uniref:hypothetical protein n=1 Tax=Chthoniobacter sp. TaxID=2510640 RepID=UPI0032AA065F
MKTFPCLFFVLVVLLAARASALDAPLAPALPEAKDTSIKPLVDTVISSKPASDTTVLSAPLKVTLTPAESGPRDIFDELTFFVDLENVGDQPLTIRSIYFQMPDDVKRTRAQGEIKKADPAEPASPSSSSVNGVRGAINRPEDGLWEGREEMNPIILNARGKRTERLVIPQAGRRVGDPPETTRYFRALFDNGYLLTFTPKEHDINAMVEYDMDSGNTSVSQRSSVRVPFTATWGAIMLGGCLGVAMLAAFRVVIAAEQELRNYYKDETPPEASAAVTVRRRARRVVMRELISAAVWLPSVIIISFLLWRMGPSSFPISFQVNDFTGGVLLGLFTRALVEPLVRKLFPTDAPAPEPAKAEVAPAEAAVAH